MSVRVLYDVAELGPHGETGGGGIRRVTENVARGLLFREDVDVRFSGLSFNQAAEHAAFLTKRGGERDRFRYGGVELLDRLTSAAHRSSTTLAQRRVRAGRVAQQLLAPLQRFSRRRALHVSARALRDADIYHSPFRPLPTRQPSGKRELAFFITIYDLIPITHPEFAGAFFCDAARRILSSIKRNHWILCISQFVKDQVCEHLSFPPKQVFVTPLAASPDTFRPCDTATAGDVLRRYGIEKTPFLLSVGANDARKNIPHLIECFGRVVRSGEDRGLQLVLVGARNDGPAAEAVFQRYPEIRPRVVFTGYVANEDLSAIYSSATAFAFPSLVEGFGLPPLEAMQCGLPVICSNAASLPEVVGDAGLLLEPTDHDAWCEAIVRLVRDDDLRRELSRRSLSQAAQFSWEATTEATVRAYKVAVGASADCPAAAMHEPRRVLQNKTV